MVVVFAREITDSLTSLVKSIDAQVGEKKLKAFVVLLTDDVDAATKKLADVAKENDIKNTPLTIYEGVSGPEKYKIAKDAEVTVLMWNKRVVRANHAFAKGKLTDEAVKTVVGDTSKIQN